MAGQGNSDQRLDEMKVSLAELQPEGRKELANAAVRAVSDEAKKDVVTAAVQAVPDDAKKDVLAAAVQAVPDDAKKDLVTAAVQDAGGAIKREVADAAVRSLSTEDQEALAERFLPDQPVTNEIWLTVVRTFAVVLIGAALALFAVVFVSMFREDVDAAMVQILLTAFTTVAGMLAGFISGRTSVGRGSR
jgi:hypothetical protein